MEYHFIEFSAHMLGKIQNCYSEMFMSLLKWKCFSGKYPWFRCLLLQYVPKLSPSYAARRLDQNILFKANISPSGYSMVHTRK